MARHLAQASADVPGRRRRRRGGVGTIVAALVLLVLGGALLLMPSVSSVMEQEQRARSAEELRREVVSDAGASSDADAADEFRSKEGDSTYEALERYNEEVREGTGDQINDPFAFSGDELAEMGLPDGVVGTIDIPSMDMTLPLYLGATEENMMKGATVIAGTSMPIGETSSNCVIAAHRGVRGVWSGPQMFRDIELMEVGDTVTITTPWERLTYRACEIRVITPDDVDALAVQEGRDLVTLFTCHPYGQHTHRYLVYCERVDNDEAQESPGLVERAVRAYLPAASEGSPALTVELVLRVAGLAALVVIAAALVVTLVRRMRGAQRGG